jgi:hypothetical protein
VKKDNLTKTVMAVALTAGLGLAVVGIGQTATAANKGEARVAAITYNNPLEFKKAGFPATALSVNRTADGKLSWMATQAEMQRKQSFESTYLKQAKNIVAASISDSPIASSQLFGVADTSTYMVGPTEFVASSQATLFSRSYAGYDFTCPSGEGADEYVAPLQLPAGAIVTGMTAYGNDSSAADDADYYVYRSCPGGTYNGSGNAPEAHVTSGFTGGAYTVNSAASNLTIDNSDCHYTVMVDFSEGTCDGGNNTLGVALRWKRQVSPAPVTATFLDVPVGSTFHREVEALVSAGITGGCGGGNYCVNANVTRGQMAAFLSRALGLHWQDN